MDERLPEGWVWTTLEAAVEVRDDLRVPVNADERVHRSGPYPYYGATGQVGWIDDYLMDGEYVLLGEDGAPFLDPVKPKAYIISGKSWVNNHAHVLHFLEGMGNNRYLMYALNAVDYRSAVNGTTRLKLTQSAMKQIVIPLAPHPEQSRIVAAIEQQFTRLDSAVASLQSAKARVKQYRASLLKSAVEGELTKEWRSEHSTTETGAQLLARILTERRARWEEEQLAKMREQPKDDKWKQAYKEPQGPDVEQLPALPVGWCWATVEQIGDASEQVVLTGPFGSTLGKEDFKKEGIPLLTIGCLTEQGLSLKKAFYISEEKASELERYKVRTDDMLFSRMASVGRADLVTKKLGNYSGCLK